MLSDRARVAGPKRGMRPGSGKKRARPERSEYSRYRPGTGRVQDGYRSEGCAREERRRNATNASTCIAESRGVQVHRVANHSRQPANNLLVFHVRFDSLSFCYLYLPGLLRISRILPQGGRVASRGWRFQPGKKERGKKRDTCTSGRGRNGASRHATLHGSPVFSRVNSSS